MQSYFVAKEQFIDNKVYIKGSDAFHLVRVMRAHVGDQVICSNGTDREVLCTLTHIDKDEVIAVVVEERLMVNEARLEVWIAQSLPKGDKLETVIQKCTEIGAARIIPFISARTIVQYDDKKAAKLLDRWVKIAKEAAEQAHRNRIPPVFAPYSWQQVLQLASEVDLAMVCYEKESRLYLREVLTDTLMHHPIPLKVLLMIGPEGGFTEQEIAEAEAAGYRSISLGPRIMRTETAALVGLTCILYASGEMGA